jgi:hypothetical protein
MLLLRCTLDVCSPSVPHPYACRLDVPPVQLEGQWQQLRELVLRSVAVPAEGDGDGDPGGGDAGSIGGSTDGAGAGAWAVLPRLPQLTGVTVVAGLVAPLRAGAVAALARSRSVQSVRIGRYAEPALPDLPPGALPALSRLRLSVAPELEALPPSWCEVRAPAPAGHALHAGRMHWARSARLRLRA